ncbi:MAG: hypothetical protein WCH76_04525 [Candidatus Riflemargulisbacteria bacterium]
MNTFTLQIPALANNQPKTLTQYGKEYLATLTELFPIESFHTKTIASLIGIIAENNKHNENHPIDINITINNDNMHITAKDEGPGFRAPILQSIQEKFSTAENSMGQGLFSLLIIVITCNGRLIIQSNKLQEKYSFQKASAVYQKQIMIDQIISAIEQPITNNESYGLHIEIIIPMKSIDKRTSHLDLDAYSNF